MNKWISCFAVGSSMLAHANGQPAIPPDWVVNPTGIGGATSAVFVFSPTASSSQINAVANEVYSNNGGTAPSVACSQQFVDNRYALLFQPGSYPGSYINVGYYTSVAGLGTGPAATQMGDVTCPQSCGTGVSPGALNTFWRSAENFTTTPTIQDIGPGLTAADRMVWATSQACPLRQIVVNGSLWIFQIAGPPSYAGTFASGGFMADCTITSSGVGTNLGSQQQFFIRNSDLGMASAQGVWSQVFVGCDNAPDSQCFSLYSNPSSGTALTIANVGQTPLIAEKPFISYSSVVPSYYLNIPAYQTNKKGTSLDDPPTVASVPFTDVYVAEPGASAAAINAQISAGNHVVLSPGIYNLEAPINVSTSGACLLGIGLPTLIPTSGTSCIVVTADHVRVGGVLLQAGPEPTPNLLQWGNEGATFSEGYLYDCFTRIGRFDAENAAYNQVDVSVQINSPHIVLDNLWLWRADHDAINSVSSPTGGVTEGNNPSLNGLVVDANASNVIAYGLAVEHQLEDLVQWNGNDGQCYFFQAEYPYDVSPTYASEGYVAYRVDPSVTSHEGYGMGAYSNFWNSGVEPSSGFIIPSASGVQLNKVFTIYLNNNGGIKAIVNNQGQPVVNGFPGPYPVCQSVSDPIRTSPVARYGTPPVMSNRGDMSFVPDP